MSRAGYFVIFVMGFIAALARAEPPYSVLWSRRAGTSEADHGSCLALDSFGNVYLGGTTWGALAGPNAGECDAFLSKYDGNGGLLWSRQLGTYQGDFGLSVAADAWGNVYLSGYTGGGLAGGSAGGLDAFLSKYDTDGGLLWSRQLGTVETDRAYSVAADALGNAYLTGGTTGRLAEWSAGDSDAFLAKYDATGRLVWSRQTGTAYYDSGYSVAADPLGNTCISGGTQGPLAGPAAGGVDAFVSRYDPSGALLWSRQLGTSAGDYSECVALDSLGNAYLSGSTQGALAGPNAGGADAFVAKYDTGGRLLWSRQLGTDQDDYGRSVAVDAFGNAYLSGSTKGDLGGASAGGADVFLAKYDANGVFLWSRQIGTSDADTGCSVAVDAPGNAYLGGHTSGALAAPSAGGADAFLVAFAASQIGDFNFDRRVDATDIDMLWAVRGTTVPPTNALYDLDRNGRIDLEDARRLIEEAIGISLADTNLDGCVDLRDLGNLANRYQRDGGFGDGDANFDGAVTLFDLAIMAADWGKVFSLGASSSGVGSGYGDVAEPLPEPASLALLALGGLAVVCPSRRSGRRWRG